MTKKTFLKKFREKLTNLDEKKQDEILNKYETIIDDEVKSGKIEKEVISSLGSIDLIAKIYTTTEEDKEVKGVKEPKEKTSTTNENVVDKVFKAIDSAFENIDDKLAKRILLIMCLVFVAIIGLAILNIPFRLLDFIGTRMFRVLLDNYYLSKITSSFWSFGIWICYAIIVIWLVVYYVNYIIKHYADKSNVKPKSKSQPKTETIKEEKHTQKIDDVMNKVNPVLDIIYTILKVFVILMTIPLICAILGLCIAFFTIISLIITGISLFGPALIILGFIFLLVALLDLIYASISNKGVR